MSETIAYHWVNSTSQLADVCRQARQKSVVTLDTEFIRIRSFYPKLGLIQLYDGDQVSLIDPLAIDDFSPFVALLADSQVLKVLHASSEDLEVFHHAFQQIPTPMLDTQIMAGFAGIGVSVGFAALALHYLDKMLDKGASRTDWLARPLSDEQLQYAAADVFYLLPMYQALSHALAQTPWQQAVTEECEAIGKKRTADLVADNAYKEIGNAWQLNPQQLAVLKVLAKWRLEEAKKRDLALNFVVKEQNLFEIAKQQPKHTAELLKFMHPNEVRRHGKKLLWLVEQGQAVLPENYPEPISRLIDEPGYKATLKRLQMAVESVLPPDLPLELLAGKRRLNQLFSWHQKGQSAEKLPELLQGWRAVYGKKLLECLG